MASRKSKKRVNRGRQMARPVPAQAIANPKPFVNDQAGLKPKPALDERAEDTAIFANVAREQLSDELKIECMAVIESLDAIAGGNFDQANERLKNIARSSPYADWRLFVRGLCGFYGKDFETAKQNWQRLDVSRRPARIAATLIASELKLELAGFSTPQKRLVEHAGSLLHRSSAIVAARKITSIRHRDSETRFSSSQVALLKNFRNDFQRVDTDFVAKFSQACVYLSCAQPTPDSFMLLQKSVPGPPHDPSWRLLEFLYMRQFEDTEEEREATAEAYIEIDLPSLTHYSNQQKDALASCIWLDLAREHAMCAAEIEKSFFDFDERPDYKAIEKLLNNALKRCPSNRDAHKLLLDILNRQIQSRRSSYAEIKFAEKRQIKAEEAYVRGFPGEIEISLKLVDYYFSNDQLDKADALVKQLNNQRLDAPLAKALPWKLQLLAAMHYSRKKVRLDSARKFLATADSQWPSWLPRTWLPFLKAALELRAGNQELFESLDNQARQEAGVSQIVGDFMTFAAVQQLNVPAAVIKPFREKTTMHIDELKQLQPSDLVSIGAFFWDLARTGLQHKGFRSQASKVGKELCSRLKNGEKFPSCNAFVEVVCFCATRGFWQNNVDFGLSPWAEELTTKEPKVAAAFIGWANKSNYARYFLKMRKPLIEMLQSATKTEKDPFYRYCFEQVAVSANEIIEEEARRNSVPSFMSQFFDRADNEDDEPDENCQCAQCRAKRAQEEARNSQSFDHYKSYGYEDEDDDEDDEDDDAFDEDENAADFDLEDPVINALMLRITAKLGSASMEAFVKALSLVTSESQRLDHVNPVLTINRIVDVFNRFGLSDEEAINFIDVISRQVNGKKNSSTAQTQWPPMTPEERKAADKKRRRELEKKKRC